MKERIEKESGVQLNDFPESDFKKVKAALTEMGEIEVWLLKGMGRWYITAFAPNGNDSAFPLQRKLCNLTNKSN